MKNRKIRVLGAALVLMLFAAGCQSAENPAQETHSENVAETAEDTPMFTDPAKALEQIQELCAVYLNPNLIESDGYERFMALVSEGTDLLAQETVDDAVYCALAEELTEAYDAIEYQRGDVPRVYLNTYIPTPNYAESSSITVTSEPSADESADMAADGDSKTYWLSDENEEQTLTLDMGRMREIGYICVEWGRGAAKHYEIDMSADAETWETVYVIEDGAKYKTQGFELEVPATGRYLRIRMLTASSLPYQLEEITAAERKPERAAALTTEYSEAEVVIVDREGGTYPAIAETVQVKVRGNSTANTVKNPYNIKFERKKTQIAIASCNSYQKGNKQ